jgi:hypothetical protein
LRRPAPVPFGIGAGATAAAKVVAVNWTRLLVRASIIGAILTAVAVFFLVGFRRLPPSGAEVRPEAAQTR